MENAIIDEFTVLINKCRGKVFFVTDNGERLVADSMLSALVGFSSLLTADDEIPRHIECEQDTDCGNIVEFIKKHHLGKYWSI